MGLAAGGLFGNVFLELLPESYATQGTFRYAKEKSGSIPELVLAMILMVRVRTMDVRVASRSRTPWRSCLMVRATPIVHRRERTA